MTLWHRNKKFGTIDNLSYICSNKIAEVMMNDEDRLVRILQLSHSQILAGNSYSQEEAEQFLDQRLYQFRDKMVGTGVAESC